MAEAQLSFSKGQHRGAGVVTAPTLMQDIESSEPPSRECRAGRALCPSLQPTPWLCDGETAAGRGPSHCSCPFPLETECNGKQRRIGRSVPISPRAGEPLFVSRPAVRCPAWSAEFTEPPRITPNQVLFQVRDICHVAHRFITLGQRFLQIRFLHSKVPSVCS